MQLHRSPTSFTKQSCARVTFATTSFLWWLPSCMQHGTITSASISRTRMAITLHVLSKNCDKFYPRHGFGWNMQTSSNQGESWTALSCLDQKLDILKGRGFVEGLLFARIQCNVPELFFLDIEGIGHIQNEARCCVIALAL